MKIAENSHQHSQRSIPTSRVLSAFITSLLDNYNEFPHHCWFKNKSEMKFVSVFRRITYAFQKNTRLVFEDSASFPFMRCFHNSQ